MKKAIRIIAALLAALMLTACSAQGETPQAAAPEVDVKPALTIKELQSSGTLFTDRDLNGVWDDAAATHITLGATPVIEGEGATAQEGGILLSAAGVYVLTGDLLGQITVAAGKSDKLQIVLNGVSVTAADGPAIYIKTADKVFMTVAEGTKNTIKDASDYAADEEDPNAAIYSKSDLSINGAGTLNVTGAYKHGVVSKDELVLADASFNITSAGDGVKGKDCVKTHNATLNINAGGDGVQSSHTGDANIGYVLLDGGTYNITAAKDGVQAATRLETSGGTFNIVTGGGSAAAPEMTREGMAAGGAPGGMAPPDGAQATPAAVTPSPDAADGAQGGDEDTSSAKGLKAGTDIQIQNGEFTIDAMDDAIHANGSVTLLPDTIAIASGDDGVHAGGALTVNGGSIAINESYEGLEGGTVTILDGVINVTAFDDGVNAAGGADSSSLGGRWGAEQFASDSTKYIDIRGGTLHVNACGDGLDSNGDFLMSGGMVTVSGSEDAGNGGLDYNGKGEISGGAIIAVGNAGMSQAFSDTSTQCVLAVYYTQTQEAGRSVTLKEGENVLAAYAPEKAYSMAVISAPGMEKGKIYALYSDNEKLTETTLTGIVTGINEKGEAASGMGAGSLPQGERPSGGRGGNGQNTAGAQPDGAPDPNSSARPEGTPPAGMGEPPEGGMGQPPQGGGQPPQGEPPTDGASA